MTELSGFPFYRFKVDSSQVLEPPTSQAGLVQWVDDHSLSDVWVVSHGWNNSESAAMSSYKELFDNVAGQMGSRLDGRQLGIVGIVWPSKQFALPGVVSTAASLGVEGGDTVKTELQELKKVFPEVASHFDDALAQVDMLELDAAAKRDFVKAIVAAIDGDDEEDDDGEPDISGSLKNLGGDALDRLADVPADFTGAQAAGFIGNLFGGAMNLLNMTTYYKMKKRAARTGKLAVSPALQHLLGAAAQTPRLHLIGHSFGGLVVSATANAGGSYASVTLLQSAFSHNAFSAHAPQGVGRGRFRDVMDQGRVQGAMAVTHTKNDKAVGVAYPLASRLAGQTGAAAALGDANDKFGGIGRNGALHLASSEHQDGTLATSPATYAFQASTVHNLLADQTISDHGDVWNAHVADVVIELVRHTGP